MYGSVLIVLSTLEFFGTTANPQLGKAALGRIKRRDIQQRREREHANAIKTESREVHGLLSIRLKPTRTDGPLL